MSSITACALPLKKLLYKQHREVVVIIEGQTNTMSQMSAKRHLKELQIRLLIVSAFFFIGACLAYSYQEQLVPLLMAPLHGERLIYLNPAGGFTFIFLISIYAGIALAFPVLLQQIYSFLRPALPDSAQRNSWKLVVSSLTLLVCGLLFGYFIAVPNALDFLYGFADKYVDASLTAESYLNFMIAYTIGIGIVFQLPLLLLLIHAIRPLTPGGLMRSQRWVILGAFIVAAIITPTPDPVNQAIIAIPVVVVYQLGVFAVLISISRAKRRAKVEARKNSKSRVAPEQPVLPVVEPAQPIAANPQPESAAPVVHAAKVQPAPRKTLDGFAVPAARPGLAQHTRVPQAANSRPSTMIPARQQAVPARSIDGVRPPLRATSF